MEADILTHPVVVIGSSTREQTRFMPPGEGYVLDNGNDLTAEVQETVGGSGVCNALALHSAGERVKFISVGGICALNGHEGKFDNDAHFIIDYMRQQGISTYLQGHLGPTESVFVVISGRQDQPKMLFRTAGLRDAFKLTPNIIEEINNSPLVIASAFDPKVIAEGAMIYKRNKPDGIFTWSLNSKSAKIIRDGYKSDDSSVTAAFREGCVDMLFASHAEASYIGAEIYRDSLLGGVKLILETRGAQGCVIRYKNGEYINIEIPTRVVNKRNDNGAGEAHHNNFLAVVINARRYGKFRDIDDIPIDVLQTAGEIANLAARIKISQDNSVWFPQLDHKMIGEMIMAGYKAPAISREVERKLLMEAGI